MAVFRIERTRDYTVMSNHHLRNANLSLKAKGLLSMMLSLPEDWNYTTRGLAKICKEGVDAIGAALRELEAAGYIVRHKLRDRQGRISDTEYVIYEQPQLRKPDTDSPDTENPYMDKPDTEKPAELNIEKSNTQKQNIYGSSTDSIPFRDCAADCLPERKGRDAMSLTEIESYRELIQENIGYEYLCQQYETYREDLVSLLSGRDFVTKEFREDIVEESYGKLDSGIMDFINQYNFSQFVMAIKGAGYVSSKLLNSRMTLDFAYTLYLMLLDDPAIPNAQIKRYVQKWFVLSTLTSRYIGSPETQMDRDMRTIGEKGFLTFLSDVEASALSETFWTVTLPQNLETSSVNSPAFNTFLAAQINMNCNSMLMNGTKVVDLITISGDVHHIFPRSYLKSNGVDNKTKYNQVANYIYLDTQVNKAVSDDAPNVYFGKVMKQCEGGNIVLGNISDKDLLMTNLEENCIPQSIMNMTVENYDEFLIERRKRMAALIQKYYERL